MNKEFLFKGLIVSSINYGSGMPQLTGVKNAVDNLQKSLKNDKIKVLEDYDSITVKNYIIEYFKKTELEDNEIFLFYFCGHGLLAGKNMDKLVLATKDTTNENYNALIGIETSWLIDEIKKNNISNYVLVLDCCYSGLCSSMGQVKSYEGSLFSKELPGNAVVMTSTNKPSQESKEISVDGTIYAAFTYFFSKVCKNNDTISLADLFQEVKQNLVEYNDLHKADLPVPQIKSVNNLGKALVCINEKSGFNIDKYSDKFSLYTSEPLKVLLVKTAISNPIKDYDFGVPLGLWLLKSYIDIQGLNIEVDVYDERLEMKKELIKENADFEKKIVEYDVIGVSICSCEVPNAIKKLGIAKKNQKITLVGGIFTSSNEEYLLRHDCIDYIIPGVATAPLCHLLKQLLKLKKEGNLSFEKKIDYIDKVVTRANLKNFTIWEPSILPYIELDIWSEIVKRYKHYLKSKIDIYTTRGCKNKCDFCSVQRESQQRSFERDTSDLIDEIEFLYSKGFNTFSIKDENFLSGESNSLENVIKYFKGGKINFKIRARIDDILSKEIKLKNLYDLGITEIQYGLETPDATLLKNIKKGYKYGNEKLVDFIKDNTNNGIVANCSFILGIKDEEIEYYKSLTNFFESLKYEKDFLKIYINFFTPHPYKNEFTDNDYVIFKNDLQFFTHKIPVAYPKGMNRMTRKAMLNTYDDIVDMFDAVKYNPPISNSIKKGFLNGVKKGDENKKIKEYGETYVSGKKN